MIYLCSIRCRRQDTAKINPLNVCTFGVATGGIKDSRLIDYQATKNCLDAARASGSSHFVLLSAICVQKPELEFQRAKLKLENELKVKARSFDHSSFRALFVLHSA